MLEVPELVANRYMLLRDTRSGGLSTVRKAVDHTDGSFVAVKFTRVKDERIDRTKFRREAETLQLLQHRNIIRLRDTGTHEKTGSLFIVLDWIERSLADVLSENGPYEWDQLATTIAQPLTSALAYAHLNQKEHRDIKPSNVLITEDGQPVLADWNIGKNHDDPATADVTVAKFRSGPYAPPEYEGPAFLRDIYSMGVLLIQALHEAQIRDFHEVAPALEAITVPPDVRRLLEACTSTDPSRRPVNGAVLDEELRRVISECGSLRAPRDNMAWLKLTYTARQQLCAGESLAEEGSASRIALDDLSSEVYAEFRFDREKGAPDHETIIVTGQAWRLILKPDSATSTFRIIAARQLEFEDLERMRRRALRVPPLLSWTFTRPREPDAAARGMELLVRSLEDHLEARRSARDDARERGEENAIFESWLRLLDAREELARGEWKPLRYARCDVSQRQATFSLVEPAELDLLGTELEIVVEAFRYRVARGEVIDQLADEITLRLRNNSRSLPESGTLTPYLGPTQVALQRQRDAVSAVRTETAARPELRRLIVDPAAVSPPDPVVVTSWHRSLDESKQAAVAAALGSPDLLLVQGPPGTGKTSFIAETVAQFIERNPDSRVLIVSQTHVAVDNALERLESAGIKGMVRLGLPDDPRADEHVRHLLLDRQMHKWAAGLRRKAEAHLEHRAQLAGISSHHLRAALALQQLIAVGDEASRVRAYLDDQAAPGNRSELASGLESGQDSATLLGRLEGLADRRRELLDQARSELGGDLTLGAEISDDEARSAVEALIGGTGEGQALLRFLTLQAEWLQRVSSDRDLASAFLATTRVVAGTCIGFLGHRAVRNLDIDLCILDEASKATATEALVPMARARKWLLVGDTSQLPPLDEEMLRSQDLLDEHNLDGDFVRETLFQRLAVALPEHSRYMLREQYRMIRPIGDLISTCFYEGKLNSPITAGIRGYDKLGKPVLWLDTGSLGEQRREDPPTGSGTSYANRAEAQLVIDRLTILDQSISMGVVTPPRDGEKMSVLLIAPYRSQTDELRRGWARSKIRHLEVSVQSVDAVQGREADIAIFSVTRSNTSGSMGFLGPDYWRRINVALSRARYGLTIVGDAEFCQRRPGALKTVLDYIQLRPNDCELRKADGA